MIRWSCCARDLAHTLNLSCALWGLGLRLDLSYCLMQDPVLFSGTVRANIDPFGAAEGDHPIWEALERVGIKPAIAAMQVLLMVVVGLAS